MTTAMVNAVGEALVQLADGLDLDTQLACQALDEIMEGRVSESQIGAFLMGLRAKGETVEEIIAFAHVMRQKCLAIQPQTIVGATGQAPLLTDVCGTGGARFKTFNVSTIAAFVAAGAGVPVAKHGNRGVTSPCGSADLLERLGVNLKADPATVERCIEEIGVGFLFAPVFHPAMRHAALVRKSLGIRTVFNLLGPLTNPAGAQAHLMGVFDPSLVEIYPQALRVLGIKRALVAHGADGLDELSTVGPSQVGELIDDQITHYELRPEGLGLQRASLERVRALPPAESAELALRLLKDEIRDERYEMVLLNAGAGIYVGQGANSLEAGMTKAEESIRSGAAYEKLKLLVEKMG
jgi:anthranilate phosphoribosyltransferase